MRPCQRGFSWLLRAEPWMNRSGRQGRSRDDASSVPRLTAAGGFPIRRILSPHHRAATPIDCGQKQASGDATTLKGLTWRGPLQKRTPVNVRHGSGALHAQGRQWSCEGPAAAAKFLFRECRGVPLLARPSLWPAGEPTVRAAGKVIRGPRPPSAEAEPGRLSDRIFLWSNSFTTVVCATPEAGEGARNVGCS
jgi:hypothetical protein